MKKKTKGYANGGKLKMSTKMMAGGGKTVLMSKGSSVKGDDSITPGFSSKAQARRKEKEREKKASKKMAGGGRTKGIAVGGKTVARGSGAVKTQYFGKNG